MLLIRKKLERFGVKRDFWHDLFHGKYNNYNVNCLYYRVWFIIEVRKGYEVNDSRICSHLQNNPYKTTTMFLRNLTTPGDHHTVQKKKKKSKKSLYAIKQRNQTKPKKKIKIENGSEKKNFFSLCATILLKILFAFPDHLTLSL